MAKTFKTMSEVPKLEVLEEKPVLIDELLKIEGVNREMAEHIARRGVPDDSFTVQTFYRVSAMTADAVIKAVKETK